MSQTLDDIRDIFSILHDGYITAWSGDRSLLKLTVRCGYLACRINEAYEHFYIELEEIEQIAFHPWMNPSTLPVLVYSDIPVIFKNKLQINAAEIKDGLVAITCLQDKYDWDYCGGFLSLSSKTIRIFDEGRNQMTVDEMDVICNSYWDEWAKDVERRILERQSNNKIQRPLTLKEKLIAFFYKVGLFGYW